MVYLTFMKIFVAWETDTNNRFMQTHRTSPRGWLKRKHTSKSWNKLRHYSKVRGTGYGFFSLSNLLIFVKK